MRNSRLHKTARAAARAAYYAVLKQAQDPNMEQWGLEGIGEGIAENPGDVYMEGPDPRLQLATGPGQTGGPGALAEPEMGPAPTDLTGAAQALVQQAQASGDPQAEATARKVLANAMAVSSTGDYQGTYSNAFFRDMEALSQLGLNTDQFASTLADYYGVDQAGTPQLPPEYQTPGMAYASKKTSNLLKTAEYLRKRHLRGR
jgi:hypothetical protein